MKSYFVFDVESVGLHGEGFAVAGGVYLENGAAIPDTHRSPKSLRDAFWNEWMKAKKEGATMAAECGWPVEAGFLEHCIYDDIAARKWEGPYPLMEIASFMDSAGMDPMAKYDRTPSELPIHDPLADARQSARLLSEALSKLSTPK